MTNYSEKLLTYAKQNNLTTFDVANLFCGNGLDIDWVIYLFDGITKPVYEKAIKKIDEYKENNHE